MSRVAMASTARYYSEVFEMRRLTPEMINARVRTVNPRPLVDGLSRGPVVGVLSHSGNWDLAGAYCALNLAPVFSVAERVEPPEVFAKFVAMRAAKGITILPHEGGTTFRTMMSEAKSHGGLVALLGERDISNSGIPVQMWGRTVKVAAGPAALAVALKIPLLPIAVSYERLHGERRRLAKAHWGIVLEFGEIQVVPDVPKPERVAALTQQWATALATKITERPEDWHMLQRMGWVE